VDAKYEPSLQLVYLPHLDYCLQRLGPDGDVSKDLAEIDKVCGELFDYFQNRGCRVIVLSEYGITKVDRVVHPNRILRDAGMLTIKRDLGLEYMDTGACRAFAVSDHQISHVYIENPDDIPAVEKLFEGVPGIARVLGPEGKREMGLDHERSGELVLLSEPDAWFTYYFWQDDAVAPEYARMVDIHGKPGYDPVELFTDPKYRFPMVKAGLTLARKKMGFRYKMELTPLDASLVKGSHGVFHGTPHDTPVLASSEPSLLPGDRIQATDVRDIILGHLFDE
jgi:predicted AlkP superfamily pyrophosphatase or phosphodiesterase